MIIYQIKLPKKQDANVFATFMKKEYFPSIHKGPTRVGQVLSMTLLQQETEIGSASNEFLWLVGWSGLSSGNAHVDDFAIETKMNEFGAKIKRLGSYAEIAKWKPVKKG